MHKKGKHTNVGQRVVIYIVYVAYILFRICI